MTLTESEEYSDNFSDAQSDNFSPVEVFSIEGPGSNIGEDEKEAEEDEFYDAIDETQFMNNEIQNAKPLPPIPRKRLTALEFLIEEAEETEMEIPIGKDPAKRETIYEFLNEYENENRETGGGASESESSLSQLQKELEAERPEMINLHVPSSRVRDTTNSLHRRANPLASLLFTANSSRDSDDSDSMISELTEALTARTDLSEARFSRVPSMLAQPQEYLKLAKRYKAVPVKSKSKQKSEFTSLFLVQELNRSAAAPVQRNSSVNSNRSAGGGSVLSSSPSSASQPATDPSKAIFSLTFSPDGHFLAAAGAEGIITIWSLLQVTDHQAGSVPRVATIFDNEPVQVLRGHSAEILDCAWSSNNFLLTASMDKTVRLWHHSRPDALGIFQHLDYVTSVAFHPRDPRIFISGSLDCKLRLWSIQDRSIINWNELPPGNFITAVAFTRSGTSVIAGTSGGAALIFDTDGLRYNTQILVRSSRSKSVGKKITSITAVPGQFENDERMIISSNDSRIRMYSLRDKNVIYKYKGHENISSQIGASLSTEADFVLSGSEDCRVYLWRTDGKFEKKGLFSSFRKDHISSYESFKAHSNSVTAAIVAPSCVTNLLQSLQLRPLNPLQSAEGKIIVTADVTGQIKVFENNSKLIEWLK